MIRLRPDPESTMEGIREGQRRRMKTFEYKGFTYQADPASVLAMIGRTSLMELTEKVIWLDSDNEPRFLTKNEIVDMASKIAVRNDAIYAAAASLKKIIREGGHVDYLAEESWTDIPE